MTARQVEGAMVTSRRQTAACLLLLLCAVCCLSGVAVSGEQEAATGSQTRQTQTQAQTQTQTTPIETATATADDDLDNSIRQADAARTAQADDNSGEQDKRVEKNKDKTGIEGEFGFTFGSGKEVDDDETKNETRKISPHSAAPISRPPGRLSRENPFTLAACSFRF